MNVSLRRGAVSVSDQYIEFVTSELEPVGTIVWKRMFGGVGLYLDGLFFAIIENDTLRFKVDGSNRTDYTLAGMEPFKPYKNKEHTMQFYEVPIEVLEEADRLAVWAKKAYAVAQRAKKKSKK